MDAPSAEMAIRARLKRDTLGRWFVWGSFAAVILLRVLFLVTYPLNDRGGDTSNYAAMLHQGTSSLVHASGYPFLVGFPFRPHVIKYLAPRYPEAFNCLLLLVQHLIDFAALMFLYGVSAQIFGRTTAALAMLFAGLSLQSLGATSSVYPEWLQADLLIFAVGLAYLGYTQKEYAEKRALHALAAFAFTWCVLVKFNAAVLAWIPLIAIVVDASMSKSRRLRIGCTSAAVSLATIAFFVVAFHRPNTGTAHLTYDKAWVLLTKVEILSGNVLDPSHGPATRRWLALGGLLPPSYGMAGAPMFSHVDAVPPEVRAPYRDKYGFVLSASDAEVTRVLARTRLPDGFSVGLSPIPVGYYLGLAESDALGVQVAREAFLGDVPRYVRGVWQEVQAALRTWPSHPHFPDSAGSLRTYGVVPKEVLPLGFIRIDQRPDWSRVPFVYGVPVLWGPGITLFGWLNGIAPTGAAVVWLALAGIGAALAQVLLKRTLQVGTCTILVLGAAFLMIVVASSATLLFRWKEARLLVPVVAVLAAFPLGTLISAVATAVTPRSDRDRHLSHPAA